MQVAWAITIYVHMQPWHSLFFRFAHSLLFYACHLPSQAALAEKHKYMYVHHVNMYFLCLGRQTEFKIYVDTQYIRILYSLAHMCASTGRFCITPQASHVSRLLTHRHTRTQMCRHNFPINNIKCPRRHFLFDVRCSTL